MQHIAKGIAAGLLLSLAGASVMAGSGPRHLRFGVNYMFDDLVAQIAH